MGAGGRAAGPVMAAAQKDTLLLAGEAGGKGGQRSGCERAEAGRPGGGFGSGIAVGYDGEVCVQTAGTGVKRVPAWGGSQSRGVLGGGFQGTLCL